jgi:hypothetical protein
MASKARYGLAALVLAMAAFAAGLAGLFRDRLETGDIYPAYSTLRSDPMGCRALFAALENLEGARTGRAVSEEQYRDGREGTVYFFLGQPARWGELDPMQAKDLDSLAKAGGRVILTWKPAGGEDGPFRRVSDWRDSVREDSLKHKAARADSSALASDSAGTAGTAAGKAAKDTAKPAKAAKPKQDPFAGRFLWSTQAWGYRLALDTSSGDSASLEALGAAGDSVAWISDHYFDSLAAAWTVHYRRDGRPVVIERALGKGSLVLVADTYWASNEALFHSRPGRLLSLLLADRPVILFDELHLGIQEGRSLVNLLRKYRLHLLLPSFLLLFLLYLWKSRAGSAPETAASADPDPAPAGERGMRGLLARYIPADQLLQACLAQWKETEGRNSPAVRRAGAEAEAIAAASAARPKDLVQDYRKIQDLINKRKSQ